MAEAAWMSFSHMSEGDALRVVADVTGLLLAGVVAAAHRTLI